MDIPPSHVLPAREAEFRGTIGDTYSKSVPDWPKGARPPKDAPNISSLSENGLRYNNFHTVGLCAPTRASLLTGRNHHAVGFGLIPELATG